jgi:hypothetical protein
MRFLPVSIGGALAILALSFCRPAKESVEALKI